MRNNAVGMALYYLKCHAYGITDYYILYFFLPKYHTYGILTLSLYKLIEKNIHKNLIIKTIPLTL